MGAGAPTAPVADAPPARGHPLGTAGKLAQGRSDDLAHNGLHLLLGLLGLALARGPRAPARAGRFAQWCRPITSST